MTNPLDLIVEEPWYKPNLDRKELRAFMQKDEAAWPRGRASGAAQNRRRTPGENRRRHPPL